MESTSTQSESISQICAALAKAQGSFKPILKNRTVEVSLKDGKGKYKFTYATLDSVLDATRAALSDNGICHTAMIRDGFITVKLYHSSGEWFGASVPVPPVSAGWQAFGSAITYARRYLLTPLLGVASEEDDDGNAAEGNQLANVDPMQPLWDAIDKTAMKTKTSTEIRTWCEMVLGRAIPQPDSLTKADLPVLLAALAKDTAKPVAANPVAPPSNVPPAGDNTALVNELNTALNELKPWGSATDGKPAKDVATIRKVAKLQWANAMKGGKPLAGFNEMSGDELRSLIAKAKAGEVPECEYLQEWMEAAQGDVPGGDSD